MNNTYGDGNPAPPHLTREVIDLQRACRYIARKVKEAIDDKAWINVEADVSQQIAQLVFHFGDRAVRSMGISSMYTVEIDFTLGHSIDDRSWLDRQTVDILEKIASRISDLLMPEDLDFLLLSDENGEVVYQSGTPIHIQQNK